MVQLTNSLFYITLLNTLMLALTFWYTTGYEIASKYLPWVNVGIFLAVVALVNVIVAVLDYVLIYPSRQGFINEQACKHPNPAMESLVRLEADMAKVKAKLGVKDG